MPPETVLLLFDFVLIFKIGSSGKCVPVWSDFITESTEKALDHTKKKEEKGSERALTRISRKTRKETKDLKCF